MSNAMSLKAKLRNLAKESIQRSIKGHGGASGDNRADCRCGKYPLQYQ